MKQRLVLQSAMEVLQALDPKAHARGERKVPYAGEHAHLMFVDGVINAVHGSAIETTVEPAITADHLMQAMLNKLRIKIKKGKQTNGPKPTLDVDSLVHEPEPLPIEEVPA